MTAVRLEKTRDRTLSPQKTEPARRRTGPGAVLREIHSKETRTAEARRKSKAVLQCDAGEIKNERRRGYGKSQDTSGGALRDGLLGKPEP
jgi:hypothetical protein